MDYYQERVRRLHEHVMKNQQEVERVDYRQFKMAELKKLLDEKGIAYEATDKKDDLIAKLEA